MAIESYSLFGQETLKNFGYLSKMPPTIAEAFRNGLIPSLDGGNLLHYLSDFRPTYPDFQQWLNGKVLPEVSKNPDQREVILPLSPDRKVAVGFAIVKNTFDEKKICSFYILPQYQHLGYGSTLMEECFRYLGTTTPLITMPERCKKLFEGLLRKYQCSLFPLLCNEHSQGA